MLNTICRYSLLIVKCQWKVHLCNFCEISPKLSEKEREREREREKATHTLQYFGERKKSTEKSVIQLGFKPMTF